MWSISLIVVVTLVSVYIFKNVKTYLELRNFGGPWPAGWTRLWLLRCHIRGSIHTTFTDINDKYGK